MKENNYCVKFLVGFKCFSNKLTKIRRYCWDMTVSNWFLFVILFNVDSSALRRNWCYSQFMLWIRDQQWIVFSLLISTHEMLSMSKSTVSKFNYSDSFVLTTILIYNYRLQWVWLQRWHQTHNIRSMFNSYAYLFRFIT